MSPPALIGLLLAIGVGATIAWLGISYEPPATPNDQAKDKPVAASKDTANKDVQKDVQKDGAKDAGKSAQPDVAKTMGAIKDKVRAEAGAQQPDATTGAAAKAAKQPSPKAPTVPGSLAVAPIEGLSEPGATGALPVIASDGRTPFSAYARPFADARLPRLALLVGGLGLNANRTQAAINSLPKDVTLAFSPYGRDLQNWVDKARAAGHEVMVELPLEPQNFPVDDPGPLAVLRSLPLRTNLERLEKVMGKFVGYIGAVGFMGAGISGSDGEMRPILQRLNDSGLMYLDNREVNEALPAKLFKAMSMPGAYVDRRIDLRHERSAIERQLRQLERLAEAEGQAIGLAADHPMSIEIIVQWARGLRGRDFQLTPISAVINRQP